MNPTNREIIMIVAYLSHTRAIGRNGELPWKSIPTDMRRFTRETTGHTVIMGSKTFWSIDPKYRPLKNRTNIVVTRNIEEKIYPENVPVASSIQDAIHKAPTEKIFLIGGQGIYQEGISIANTILATIVHYDDGIPCDAFFPPISEGWKPVFTKPREMDEESQMVIQFVTFINTKNPPASLADY